MGQTYRSSRNLEASTIDFINDKLKLRWSNVTCIKGFQRAYSNELPVITVRLNTSSFNKVELGDNNLLRKAQILIDIFANSDGQRLDLKDFIIAELKDGYTYYEYYIEANGTTGNGQVKRKVKDGKVNVLSFTDAPIDFNTEKNNLDKHDRYRHLLTLEVSTSKVE